MLKRVLAGLVLAVTLVGVAHSGPLEDGQAAVKRGDYAEAVKCYRLAADQGDAKAYLNLGAMYYQGTGVPQDYAEAAKWFRLGADTGEAGAQGLLGAMYSEGKGVPQDYVLAYVWYNLAAAHGSANIDVKTRDLATNFRDIAASRLTREQLAEAQRLSREWKPSQP